MNTSSEQPLESRVANGNAPRSPYLKAKGKKYDIRQDSYFVAVRKKGRKFVFEPWWQIKTETEKRGYEFDGPSSKALNA